MCRHPRSPDAKYCGVTKERSDHQGRDRVPRVSPRPNNEQLYTPNNLQSDKKGCDTDLLPFLVVYGMMNGMDVKIDKSGRIVVPKPLRDRLGLKPEMELEVQEQADGLFLRVPVPHPTMVNVDGLWVHQGTAQANADWARVLEDVREERLRAVGSD